MDVTLKTQLKKLALSLKDRRIVVFGDTMLDSFVRGQVSRISPEAPVPVVRVVREEAVPGGAGNVALNLCALGAKVSILTVIGHDEPGNRLLELFKEKGIDTSLVVRDTSRPTTEKIRVIAEHQQVVRFDRESSEPLSPILAKKAISHLTKAIAKADGMILSDYGKGMINSSNIRTAVSACRKQGIPLCVDPKVENFRKYRGVTCMTPNTKEACEGMGVTISNEQDYVAALGRKIVKRLGLESLLITQGANGMTLFENGKKINIMHTRALAKEVFDVTGAGDTVISVLTLALSAGATPELAMQLANHAAGIVVGKLGTATTTPREIIRTLR